MQRAQRTLELLDLGLSEPYPWQSTSPSASNGSTTTNTTTSSSNPARLTNARVTVTDKIREWNYGDYEGITSSEIRQQRTSAGLGPWDIWRDGCPGGESPAQIMERMDSLIEEIRREYHGPHMGKSLDEKGCSGDVLVVAHGHILRAFAMRWIGKGLEDTKLIMDAGGVGTLSYEHKSIDEPAILLGGGFVVGKEIEKEIEGEEREGKVK